MTSENNNGGGYGNPPVDRRFKKGQSGNPRGRPRGRHRELPYEAVLGQMVKIRKGGIEQKVTAEEAFILMLETEAKSGNQNARKLLRPALEARRFYRSEQASTPDQFIIQGVRPGSITPALRSLRIASKLDAFRDTARMAIEPWIVIEALSKFGDKRLTIEEQKTILKATRTPKKVNWPEWWEALP